MLLKNLPPIPDAFLPYEELEAYVEKLAAAAPELVQVSDIGLSRGKRRILLLSVTNFATGAPERKPAFLIQAHIHCHELGGTIAALYTVRQLILDHVDGGILDRVVFQILPRLNPDGAEEVIRHSGYIRSRWDQTGELPNTLVQEDVDGDGLILSMRIETPDGDMVRDSRDPRCLVPRRADSTGPFYRMLPEGTIHNWDGVTREGFRFHGRMLDWNRNWGAFWSPFEAGAGDYPMSEPEIRYHADFLVNNPNFFGGIAYHNGWGAILRAPDQPGDDSFSAADLRCYRKLAEMGEQLTGYPAFAGCKFHSRSELDTHRAGNFTDWLFFHLGLFGFVIELGTVETSSGLDTRTILNDSLRSEEEYCAPREVLADDDRHPERRRAYHPWRPFLHPQLGPVEIGGVDIPVFAVPAPDYLRKVCERVHAFTLHLASKCPRLVVSALEVVEIGDLKRVRLRLHNRGEFPTNISEAGARLPARRKPLIRIHPQPGVEIISLEKDRELNHFAPWESRTLEWFLAGTPNTGTRLAEIELEAFSAGSLTLPVTVSPEKRQ